MSSQGFREYCLQALLLTHILVEENRGKQFSVEIVGLSRKAGDKFSCGLRQFAVECSGQPLFGNFWEGRRVLMGSVVTNWQTIQCNFWRACLASRLAVGTLLAAPGGFHRSSRNTPAVKGAKQQHTQSQKHFLFGSTVAKQPCVCTVWEWCSRRPISQWDAQEVQVRQSNGERGYKEIRRGLWRTGTRRSRGSQVGPTEKIPLLGGSSVVRDLWFSLSKGGRYCKKCSKVADRPWARDAGEKTHLRR